MATGLESDGEWIRYLVCDERAVIPTAMRTVVSSETSESGQVYLTESENESMAAISLFEASEPAGAFANICVMARDTDDPLHVTVNNPSVAVEELTAGILTGITPPL